MHKFSQHGHNHKKKGGRMSTKAKTLLPSV